MPKNKGKGGKNRRRGKNENEEKRELVFKEHGQEYAQVLRMLGNGRLEAQCVDGIKRLCHIRGKMRKKVGLLSVAIRVLYASYNSPVVPYLVRAWHHLNGLWTVISKGNNYAFGLAQDGKIGLLTR